MSNTATIGQILNPTWEFIEWLGDNGWRKLSLTQEREWVSDYAEDKTKHYTIQEVHNIWLAEKFPA